MKRKPYTRKEHIHKYDESTSLSSNVKPSYPPGHVNLAKIGPTGIGQNVPLKASNHGIDGEVGVQIVGLLRGVLPVPPKVVGGVRRVVDVSDPIDHLDDVNLPFGRPSGTISRSKHPWSLKASNEGERKFESGLTDSWPGSLQVPIVNFSW